VSHDASELLEVADRCWTIHQGELHGIEPEKLRQVVARQGV
jgi:energy-coupling factor transport system ATP-binding protein